MEALFYALKFKHYGIAEHACAVMGWHDIILYHAKLVVSFVICQGTWQINGSGQVSAGVPIPYCTSLDKYRLTCTISSYMPLCTLICLAWYIPYFAYLYGWDI